MSPELDSTRYPLQAEPNGLNSAPLRDMAAIDRVITKLESERRRVQAADLQAVNDPIESPTHR